MQDTFKNVEYLKDGRKVKYQEILNIGWLELREDFDELNRIIMLEPLNDKYDCCSNEYVGLANFFNRCFWLFQGCTYNDNVALTILYQRFIQFYRVCQQEDGYKILIESAAMFESEDKSHVLLRDIDLNDQAYVPPEDLISEYKYGIIKERNRIELGSAFTERIQEYIQFVPSDRLEKVKKAKVSKVPCITQLFVLPLMYPSLFRCLSLHLEEKD